VIGLTSNTLLPGFARQRQFAFIETVIDKSDQKTIEWRELSDYGLNGVPASECPDWRLIAEKRSQVATVPSVFK
jgi:hypothetical protein